VLLESYRRMGADPPWGDPRRYHGVAMEGYFWRFTHEASGRVAIVMCGVNQARGGDRWAFVGLAAHPGGFFRWAALQDAHADPDGYGVRAGAAFSAGADHVRLDLGPDCRLDAVLDAPVAWPRRAFGGLGGAHAVPGLSQYWHPHLFAAGVRGRVTAGPASFSLDGAGAYAEKNWGAGFPDRWWWGQAHDFGDAVSVAFAGGPVGVGPARMHATAAVVRLDGRVLRCRPPATVALEDGAWRLRARAGVHRVEIEGAADPATAHALTVPVPAEHRAVDRSQHHLAGEMRVHVSRRGRTVFAGESALAGLERGGA
jgi:Tocopherol cyclase